MGKWCAVRGRIGGWRIWIAAVCVALTALCSSAANATITEGDFSLWGFFESRDALRWGQGGSKDNGTPASIVTTMPGATVGGLLVNPGIAATESGGSYDFNRWNLVEMRQLADFHGDYHFVKNYRLFGLLDTKFIKNADFFAFYRPWYDAYGNLMSYGRSEAFRDFRPYDAEDIKHWYMRDDLHEYYAQLDFTDNFSMRVGKQQVIWSEADALSGTEITNPADLTYHWNNFESPEDLRKNLRMIKVNYLLPDFLKTGDNELEAFVIPGDYEGDAQIANLTDPREPYVAFEPSVAGGRSPADRDGVYAYNSWGQPIRSQTFADGDDAFGGDYSSLEPGAPFLVQNHNYLVSNYPANSLKNSEFGARVSTLLPVGSGLQLSLIYLYEARDSRVGLCSSCPPSNGWITGPFSALPLVGLPTVPAHKRVRATVSNGLVTPIGPGISLLKGVYDFGPPNNSATLGTIRTQLNDDFRRDHFFGLTGSYSDDYLTDTVFRYDALWAPKYGISLAARNIYPNSGTNQISHFAIVTGGGTSVATSSAWTENARFIVGGDRPTYIPWLSKQHTLITWQYVNTWYPDLPYGTVYGPNHVKQFTWGPAPLLDFAGKIRGDNNFGFLSFTNWLINGQLTTSNVISWDFDDQVGNFTSTSVYRYSRNVLLGLNTTWYLGESGRFTDPFLFSRDQRANEVEATITFEI